MVELKVNRLSGRNEAAAYLSSEKTLPHCESIKNINYSWVYARDWTTYWLPAGCWTILGHPAVVYPSSAQYSVTTSNRAWQQCVTKRSHALWRDGRPCGIQITMGPKVALKLQSMASTSLDCHWKKQTKCSVQRAALWISNKPSY